MNKSAFYSTYSGPATTGTAQSVISTTETFFEGFLVDNYKFIDINECFHFMNLVLEQEYKLPKWIKHVSEDALINRMCDSFYDEDYPEEYRELISLYVSSLSQEEIDKIYYKNNLEVFTERHDEILYLFDELFSSVKNLNYAETVEDIPLEYIDKFSGSDKDKIKDYNSFVNREYFLDPNDPPESIQQVLKKLNEYYFNIVYMPFMSVDRIHRLKYFPRKTVCIVDTDSNILALDNLVQFFKDKVLSGSYNRSEENNKFIIINALAYFITSTVTDTLLEYGKHSYIPEDYRPRFNMKNEFYFSKLVIGRKKKRYISAIKLREGNLLEPYKPDVKGFEFMKATTSSEAKKRFDRIVSTRILESDLPDVMGILSDLKEFEDDIRYSIENGDKTFLPLGNAKDLSAYKKPYTQQGLRGALAWNLIYPDRQISFPSKVSILKLNVFSLDDLADLQDKEPRIYNTIKNDIFNSPIKDFASKGLQVLSIPSNEDIPDWCQPYIDKNTVINSILGQFKGVLDVFGVNCPEVGKMIKGVNRKTKKFSNIVRF